MTREEAIKMIENEIKCVWTQQNCKRDCENCPLIKPAGDILDAFDMAIDALQENESLAKSLNDAVELIHKLQKKNKWIPCSERLPDYGVSVLTWDGHCYFVEKRIPYICDDEGEYIYSDWWVSDDYYDENEYNYYPNLRDGAAVAWMPLPSLPYKGE